MRSILTNDSGRIVTSYNGPPPNDNHDWVTVSDGDYTRGSPPSDHTARSYIKDETSVPSDGWDDETAVIGVEYVALDPV